MSAAVRFLLALGAAAALGAFPPDTLAQRSDLRLLSAPQPSGAPLKLDKSRQAAVAASGREVSVIVRFHEDPVATYRGNVPGLAPTAAKALGLSRLNPRSPDSQRYRAYLQSRQQAFAGRMRGAMPTARVLHQYQVTFNGMAVVVPESRLPALAALPEVAAVYEDKLLQLTTDASPGFVGATALWSGAAGAATGEGAIVGVLDTGIWPEHPSFSEADASGSYAPPRGPARGCQFTGGANSGPAFACNKKLIGAYRFMATQDALNPPSGGQFTSARDDEGHGTHTASTAAGNRNVPASILGRPLGFVSGIAPRAQVVAYRVCGSAGCYGSDSVAAINQAVLDDVDVINFSISGGQNPFTDAVALAFLGAYEAGVFVATSAGNSGPGPNTTSHRSPWTTTVAASTSNRQWQSTLTLRATDGASITLNGASVNGALSAPAPVFASPTDPYCVNPFAPGSVAGKAVVCGYGGNWNADKGRNVALGGAVAVIVPHFVPYVAPRAETNFLPYLHLEDGGGPALMAFLAAHPGATATISAGTAMPRIGDVLGAFSSRGGPGLSLGIAKPDITAPGVQVLAGHTAMPSTNDQGPSGELFMAIHGTSMSAPHIAGAGALLRSLHPDWTPGQIKSALMTTASAVVYKEDGTTRATPFDTGSGRLNLLEAGNPGLTLDETGEQYLALQSRLWDANYPSLYVPALLGRISVERTVRNTRNAERAWRVAVSGSSDLRITVPNAVSVPPLGTATFSIDVDGSGIPLGEVRHAVIELRRSNETPLRFPVTVVRGTSAGMPLTKVCSPLTVAQNAQTQCSITILNNTVADASVSLTEVLPNRLQLLPGSVVNATQTGNSLQFNGVLPGATPAGVAIGTGASPAGYLPLSAFGVAPLAGMGDESIINVAVPAFTYAGETHTELAIASNGYLVVGGGSGADLDFVNQNLPSTARPNNVLAPFWTDLDPGAGGQVRIASLTDGVNSWVVVEWEAVRYYSSSQTASFQVWIGQNAGATPVQDISFTYATIQGSGDGNLLTVGAENRFGNRGQNHYYNGSGSLPAAGTALRVTSTPPGPVASRTITYTARARNHGPWTACAGLSSTAFPGTQTACVSGTVVK